MRVYTFIYIYIYLCSMCVIGFAAGFDEVADWFCIWNGDPGGHEWPRNESFVVICSPLSLVWRMLKTSPEAEDVKHFVFDEIHDASPWELYLLSYEIYRLSQSPDCGTKIYLMTATPDTRIFRVGAALS